MYQFLLLSKKLPENLVASNSDSFLLTVGWLGGGSSCPTCVLSCTCIQLARWLGAGMVGPLFPLVFLPGLFQCLAVSRQHFKRFDSGRHRPLRFSLKSCVYHITFTSLYWKSKSQVHTRLEGWGTRDHLSLQECMFWEGRNLWSYLQSTMEYKQILIWCDPLGKNFFSGKQKLDLSSS